MIIRSAKDVEVYRKAYELATLIFRVSQRFPAEERYALTGQIRRSSRSVCMCLREAWAKRRYPAHFISKLTDCDGENRNRHVPRLREGLWLHLATRTRRTDRRLRRGRENARIHDSEPRPIPPP